jgi:hypothetical protein
VLERVGAPDGVEPGLEEGRQMGILRIMWRCEQAVEWGNHYRRARSAGVTDDEMLAIRTRIPARGLDGPVAVVVRAADEVVDGTSLREESASRREPYAGSRPPWPPDGVGP